MRNKKYLILICLLSISLPLMAKDVSAPTQTPPKTEVEICAFDGEKVKASLEELAADYTKVTSFLINDYTVFDKLDEAIEAKTAISKPEKVLTTSNGLKFPSFSKCEKPFFRVATIKKKVDKLITDNGWLSGSERGVSGTGLDDSHPLTERIIQYVGIKGGYNGVVNFPKNSTIIGVLEDPIRSLSVGYHTGWTSDSEKYMRLDEIEIGACARHKECQGIIATDSSKVFLEDKAARQAAGESIREARYSTEGEWAIEKKIPKKCTVATYRIKRQKVDNVYYSGSN